MPGRYVAANWIASIAILFSAAACSEPIASYQLQADLGRIIVDFEGDVRRWPLDPVTIDSVRVDRDQLVLSISYSGGCAEHDLGLVAWSGWMESVPVQAALVVVHDAHKDQCRAIIRRTLRFDLEPLRAAYARAYRSERGTVVLRFSHPLQASAQPTHLLYWTF